MTMERSPKPLLNIEQQQQKLCELELARVNGVIRKKNEMRHSTLQQLSQPNLHPSGGQQTTLSIESRYALIERIQREAEQIQLEIDQLKQFAETLEMKLLRQNQRTEGLEQLLSEWQRQESDRKLSSEQIQQLDRISFQQFKREGSP